jgi:hypothetical protein
MKWIVRLIASVGILGGLAFAAFIGFLAYMTWTYGETDYSRSANREGMHRIVLKGQSSILTMGGPSYTREWVLDVPKAFMGVDSGSNSGSRTVTLRMGLNPETMDLIPNPKSFIEKDNFIDYFVSLKNIYALEPQSFAYKIDDYCVDQKELREQPGSYISPPPIQNPNLEAVRECDSTNCKYHIRYKGWPIEIFVSKREYLNKKKYCHFTRGLLEKWTTKIEDLRR